MPATPPVASADSLPSAPVVGEVDAFLQQMVTDLFPLRPHAPWDRGRPPVLPFLALWGGLLVCVLRGWSTQAALWRLLSQRQLWSFPRFPVSDQAVYHRLERGGTGPLERLFAQVTTVLADRLAPFAATTLAPFAAGVYALDQVKFDQVARFLPALRTVPAGDDRLLPGAMGALFNLRLQQWTALEYHTDVHQNEKVAARSLAERLPPRSLLLADLGYFGFAWFDWLTDHTFFWVSRLRHKTSYQVVHVFYQQGDVLDALVLLGKHRADRMAHAVRFIQFPVGTATYRYCTNVTDPRLLPMKDIARLYARRWDIELAFNLIKTHLKLHLLWSAKLVVLQQQVWAVLIISQVLQALRLEIAGRAGVDPFDVSLPLLVQYAPQYAADGKDPVAAFVGHGREARFLRPSRRVRIQAPELAAADLTPLPAGILLERTPRYAGRRAGSRTRPSS